MTDAVCPAVLQNSEHVTSRGSVFWDVTLRRWANGSRRFGGLVPSVARVHLTLENEALLFFETSGTTHPTTQRHISENWNPQLRLYENLETR